MFGKDQVVDGKLVRGGNRADELEHTFRFFLRGFDVYGNIGGGYDFVRDVLNHAGYVVCGVEAQGGGGFDRDVHKHVGTAFAHAQAAHPAEGELLGESLFQGLGMFLAAPVKQHGHGPAGEPEAHNDDDARNEQRGDGVRHMQNAPERAVRRKVFAGLHAKQADEHDSGGPDVRGEMQGVGFQRLAFVLLGDTAEHGGPVDVHEQGNEDDDHAPP